MKKNKERTSYKKIIDNNVFALKWIYKISPFYTIYWIIRLVVDGVSIMLEHTFLVAYIVSCIENQRSFSDVLLFFIPVTGLVVLRLTVYPLVDSYIVPKHIENIDREMRMTLYKKAVSMDISSYDDPVFFNDFIWAMQEAPGHIRGALESFAGFLRTVTVISILGIYMATVDMTGLFFVFITLFSILFLRTFFNKKKVAMELENKPNQRKRDYANRVFYLSKFAKDLRMGEIGEKIYKDFEEASGEMEKTVRKHSTKLAVTDFLISAFQHLLTFDGLYLTYLMYQTLVTHAFDFGTMVALYNSSNRLRRDLESITYIVPAFQEHSLYIEKMRTFLDSENSVKDKGKAQLPQGGNLVLTGVDFAYPSAQEKAEKTLKNISMTIKKGQKIALVGYNGAGKSTLIKLFMRLYDPTCGKVEYGGKNIEDYPLADYRNLYSVIFQDFELMAATLAENITMSGDAINEEKALEILEKTGFKGRLDSLPLGLETPVTKEFEKSGINFSGGEAQKISISHVLYSGAEIMILDEPSSALDPIAEYQLNKSITEISQDKTVIIISHRLSTTRMVDKIFMLEKGSVIEEGSHNELMKLDGKYAEMFKMQAEKYR